MITLLTKRSPSTDYQTIINIPTHCPVKLFSLWLYNRTKQNKTKTKQKQNKNQAKMKQKQTKNKTKRSSSTDYQTIINIPTLSGCPLVNFDFVKNTTKQNQKHNNKTTQLKHTKKIQNVT